MVKKCSKVCVFIIIIIICHLLLTLHKLLSYSKFSLTSSPFPLPPHFPPSSFLKKGMKAYTTVQGDHQLFRPSQNFERFARSCDRLRLPTLPVEVHFILFYFILFYLFLFLFYFILFIFILFYFILFMFFY